LGRFRRERWRMKAILSPTHQVQRNLERKILRNLSLPSPLSRSTSFSGTFDPGFPVSNGLRNHQAERPDVSHPPRRRRIPRRLEHGLVRRENRTRSRGSKGVVVVDDDGGLGLVGESWDVERGSSGSTLRRRG